MKITRRSVLLTGSSLLASTAMARTARRIVTNVAEPGEVRGPIGQIIKARRYPDASFRDVTAPNADTLYTNAFFDVGSEPWVLSIPDMEDRYSLMPMLDGWTAVFEAPGKRTTGPRTRSTRSRRMMQRVVPTTARTAMSCGSPKGHLPPVEGFWSLTMYDDGYFFVDNPLDRYSISPRQNLRVSADGSTDLYIQKDSPGKDKESNWLPAPAGDFILMLRTYWPRATAPSILDGTWAIPAVHKVS